MYSGDSFNGPATGLAMNRLHHLYCRSSHWRSTLQRLVPWAIGGIDLGEHVLELGPGPGLTSPLLESRASRVTAIDIDASAMAALSRVPRLGLVRGDAEELPFAAGSFSAAVAFTMLHHIPTPARQQQVFREVLRTLAPGGVFLGVDAQASLGLRLFHLGDTCAWIAPDEAAGRLTSAGFRDVVIERQSRFFAFRAYSPVPTRA
jgi:SAM-dependent methyltransferase